MRARFFLFLPILLVWYAKRRNMSWGHLFSERACCGLAVAALTVLAAWPYLWTLTFRSVPAVPVFVFRKQCITAMELEKTVTSDIFYVLANDTHSVRRLPAWNRHLLRSMPVNEVIAKMYDALGTAHPLPTLFLGDIRYDPGPFYFPVMWFVWTGLLTVPLIGFAIYRTWQNAREGRKGISYSHCPYAALLLFYCIGLSCVAKKISRYLVIFLPAVSILTAMGAVEFAQLWKKRQLGYLVLGVLFILQAVPILRLHPNYRVYYLPFFVLEVGGRKHQ